MVSRSVSRWCLGNHFYFCPIGLILQQIIPRGMRSAFTSVFLLMALASGVSGCSASKVNVNETPESVGERFYELLVSNDSEGMKSLFPEAQDWESMA